jgi:REP element-mobilizing transposase RayT
MGRPLRVDAAGAWHHVMNRGAGRRIVFSDDRDRELFTELLGAIDRRFGVETHAYCLMGNHYHLLMRSAAGELSPAMQHLSANFTRAVNGWRGKDGPIFRARFQSVLVGRHEHLLELCRYIHRNPAELGYRDRLERYDWSSLGPLLGIRPAPHWLYRAEVLSWFDNDAQRLAAFVSEQDDAQARGRAAPRNPQIRRDHVAGADVPVSHEISNEPSVSDILDRVERLVAAQWECTTDDVRHGHPGSRNAARLAVFVIAIDHAGLSAADLAEEYDIAPSSARASATRGRRRRAVDQSFAERVGNAVAILRSDVPDAPAA